MAKRDEKKNLNNQNEDFINDETEQEKIENSKKAGKIFLLFFIVLLVIVLSSIIPFIANLGMGMVFMALAFIVGTFYIGIRQIGFLKTLKNFGKGAKDLSPSIVIILLAFSVKYIAECGNILHTMFYYCHSYISNQSPYVAVILLYILILVFEFFIPGSAAKALLLIPLLTLAPLPGISTNIIILAFLFGDGYTNVLYPTCGTLVVGLGLAEVGYTEWLKKTGLFQILLFVMSILFLLIAVKIGI